VHVFFAPKKGSSPDLENYCWTQTLQKMTVNVPFPPGTNSGDIGHNVLHEEEVELNVSLLLISKATINCSCIVKVFIITSLYICN